MPTSSGSKEMPRLGVGPSSGWCASWWRECRGRQGALGVTARPSQGRGQRLSSHPRNALRARAGAHLPRLGRGGRAAQKRRTPRLCFQTPALHSNRNPLLPSAGSNPPPGTLPRVSLQLQLPLSPYTPPLALLTPASSAACSQILSG